MIQGYRMAGPPPHGEPPEPPPPEREWPVWLGFAALFLAWLVASLGYAVVAGTAGGDPDDPPAWVDIAGAVILQSSLIAAALIAAALYKPLHAWQFGLRTTRFWRSVGWIAVAMVAFFVFAVIWGTLVGVPEQTTVEDVGGDEGQLALILAGVLFIAVAPVAEEFFFRGFFYGALRNRMSFVWAALVCGVVFGGIHAATGPEAIPLLIVLGIAFCVVREKTGSLYPCIAMHAVNNTIAYAGQTDVEPGIAAGMGVAALIACVVVPRFAWRREPAAA
jgi:hypothetical protein